MPQLTHVALLLMVAGELAGQSDSPRAIKPNVGESFDFVSTQNITSRDRHSGPRSTSYEFTLTIKSIRDDGTLDAIVTWRRITGTASGPRASAFDTAKPDEDKTQLVAPDLLAGLRAYVGMEQRVTYDSTGTVTSLPDQDAALKAAMAKAKGFSQMQLRGLLAEGEARARIRVFQTLPASAKAQGDRWLGPATERLPQHLGNAGQLQHELTARSADRCTIAMRLAEQPPVPATKPTEDPPQAIADPSEPRDVAVRNLSDGGRVVDASVEGELIVLNTGVIVSERLQARIRRVTPEAAGEAGLTLDREVTQSLELVVRDKRDAGK